MQRRDCNSNSCSCYCWHACTHAHMYMCMCMHSIEGAWTAGRECPLTYRSWLPALDPMEGGEKGHLALYFEKQREREKGGVVGDGDEEPFTVVPAKEGTGGANITYSFEQVLCLVVMCLAVLSCA